MVKVIGKDTFSLSYINSYYVYAFQARQDSMKKNKNKAPDGSNSQKQEPSLPSPKKQKKTDKLTDKFIGKVKIPEGQKKNAKVMPTHSGPKVRHKPRPSQQQESGKKNNTKKIQKNAQNKPIQPNSFVHESSQPQV